MGRPFADEINPDSALYRDGYRRGIVAMANAGPNTNGSQFFIMHMDYPLPPAYVIFGKVTKGIETVDALAGLPTGLGPDGGMSQPLTPPIMKKVTDSAVKELVVRISKRSNPRQDQRARRHRAGSHRLR